MDWQALLLSLKAGVLSLLILMPFAILLARWLAVTDFRLKPVVEALVLLPLLLPPTVLGFYLLVLMGPDSPPGQLWQALFHHNLVFSFAGIVAALVLVNVPFAVQPAARAFEAVGADVRAASATCGLSPWRTFWRIELPLALPGILTGIILAFAKTLGEFGVVLMVGGAIPGETKTLSLSIYDRVQAFDMAAAGRMSALLLLLSLAAVSLTFFLARKHMRVGA